MPIKHTRPKVQKFDNGFIIEDTAMGPAEGKVGCPAARPPRMLTHGTPG